ncbi:MAG: low molecular weight phosphatase family protein [Actinomycetota bacterium]
MASLLFVCTGNICRSPMAEGFARRLSNDLEAGAEVGSVGIVGWDGSPAVGESVDAARERGADISGHLARRLEARHVEDAGVVVGMSREHRDAVVRLVPDAAGRTFTMKELVRLLEAAPSEGSFQDRIRAADELRRSGFDGVPSDEDVSDPLGMSFEMFRAVAWDIDEWCVRLMHALFEPARDTTAGAQGRPT